MTDIAFHFGAPNKLEYVGRLLRKAVGRGARLTVLAVPAQVQYLDASLWATSPTDFLVHGVDNGDSASLRCPVVLTSRVHPGLVEHGILVNLTQEVPAGFDQFERVIEVVSVDEEDRATARIRWKHYVQRGYAIQRHDLKLKGAE
ncbi:DNA polymerase III subunit chi [Rhodoferax sp.]|uniref:DNA polymerase III subunit chi n=1 Tax=Rhodoferax sp. TaxID=50421 RepID=UPI0025F8C455|nr:DNA polymerase III subunit chi [Rhodoferax sp.]